MLKVCCPVHKLFQITLEKTLNISLSLSVSFILQGVPPVTANMEEYVLNRGAPFTVTAPTVATGEPPATAVSNQFHLKLFKMPEA